MLSERTIINGLILIAGLILGPYLISLTFELNQVALLAFGGLVFLFIAFFFIKDGISVCPFIASYFSGNLNFLPFGLTFVEIFSLLTILYYLVNHLALKRRPPDGGPRYFLLPMLIVGGIVLYHDHQVSLGALGGSQEGSRPGLLILLAIVAYACGINIPCPSDKFISRIPIWCFLVASIGSVPFLLTTYFPSLAPYIYYVSGNVNLSAYVDSINGGDSSDLSRNGALLQISLSLSAIMVAYYPVSTWWRPTRWIFILLSLFSLYGVLIGGYRNAFLGLVILFVLGAACYSRWRVLLMLPLLLLPVLALIFVQNNHFGSIQLPTTVQRSMSFLPGEWDSDVVLSAESSNGFRDEIKSIYIKEYLYQSPWIGNGFNFNESEAEGFDQMSHMQKGEASSYFETKAFLVSKNFHIGWISVYDAVGIIGGAAFFMLNINIFCLEAYFIFQKGADMTSKFFPLKVWLFCNQFAGMVGYLTTFGSFSQTFVGLCGTAVILVYLERIERRDTLRTVLPSPQISLGAVNPLAVSSPLKLPLR